MTPRDHIVRLLDYTSKWAVGELIVGLLKSPALYSALRDGVTPEAAAKLTGMTERQAKALFDTLAVEELVEKNGTSYSLTAFGRALEEVRGYHELIVEGYAGFFRNSVDLIHGKNEPAWRNMEAVGNASTRMSALDATPTIERAMGKIGPGPVRVFDFGCADGLGLLQLCERNASLRGVGIEPNARLCELARAKVREAGLEDRIRIIESPAQAGGPEELPDFVTFSFVLHELVAQMGRAALIDYLRSLGQKYPGARFIIVEVDVAPYADARAMREDPHLRGYYNAFYLLHEFTNQRLMTFPEWEQLFAESGFALEGIEKVDPAVDATGRTAAFKLRFEGRAG